MPGPVGAAAEHAPPVEPCHEPVWRNARDDGRGQHPAPRAEGERRGDVAAPARAAHRRRTGGLVGVHRNQGRVPPAPPCLLTHRRGRPIRFIDSEGCGPRGGRRNRAGSGLRHAPDSLAPRPHDRDPATRDNARRPRPRPGASLRGGGRRLDVHGVRALDGGTVRAARGHPSLLEHPGAAFPPHGGRLFAGDAPGRNGGRKPRRAGVRGARAPGRRFFVRRWACGLPGRELLLRPSIHEQRAAFRVASHARPQRGAVVHAARLRVRVRGVPLGPLGAGRPLRRVTPPRHGV
mmetsp:Transcript_24512/g.55926  ORF Transcript_24512/g.55926 Transcript_24512/m.55926 type:complete len:291 (-) Transcript_24512:715-1587(-)